MKFILGVEITLILASGLTLPGAAFASESPPLPAPTSTPSPKGNPPADQSVATPHSDARNQRGWRLHFSEHDFIINRAYESGVTDRMLTEYHGRFELHPSFVASAALGTSTFAHSFVNFMAIAAALRFPNAKSELSFEYHHENWSNWSVAENRLASYFFFYPSDSFSIIFGLGYRGPVFGNSSFLGTFGLASVAPEINVLYRFQWEFMEIGKFSSYFLIWNYDRFRFYSENNVRFSLWPQFVISPSLKVYANLGIGIRGISGGILSWGASSLGLGLVYEH